MRRMIEKVEHDLQKEVGLVIYSGDSNPDAEAIKEAKKIEQERKNSFHAVGIWVNGPALQNEIAEVADIHVKNPSQYADILQRIAQTLISLA
jgi:hypothetical protein